jgi:hypothetical protein
MPSYSRITPGPGCFERQRLRRARQAGRVELGQAAVNPGVAWVGIGPILRIGQNDKAPRCTADIDQAASLKVFRTYHSKV